MAIEIQKLKGIFPTFQIITTVFSLLENTVHTEEGGGGEKTVPKTGNRNPLTYPSASIEETLLQFLKLGEPPIIFQIRVASWLPSKMQFRKL